MRQIYMATKKHIYIITMTCYNIYIYIIYIYMLMHNNQLMLGMEVEE